MEQKLTDKDHLTREQGIEVARHAGATDQIRNTAERTRGDVAGMAGEVMEQARTMARNVGEAASNAGATAQDLARRARDQIDPLYQQSMRAGDYLTRNVNEYPLAALLVAGMIGYMMAFLIHSRWQNQ